MINDIQKLLCGSLHDAIKAKQEITKKFNSYVSNDIPVIKQQLKQLQFATQIVSSFIKCDGKHCDIYIDILTNVFGKALNPQANAEFWESYVEHIRYLQYMIKNKAKHDEMFQLILTIAEYKNKVTTENSGKILLSMYRCQWTLTMNYLSENEAQTLLEIRFLVKAFADLYKEMLTKIITLNLRFVDVLPTSLLCFNDINFIKICLLSMRLENAEIVNLFKHLFHIYGNQEIIQPISDYYIELLKSIHMLLQFDYKSALKLQTSQVMYFLEVLQNHPVLRTQNPFNEFILSLHDYFAIINCRQSKNDYAQCFYEKCTNLKICLSKYSKMHLYDRWFGYIVLILQYAYHHLTINDIFIYVWKQLNDPFCYTILLELLYDIMKFCRCGINIDNQLFKSMCCSDTCNHILLVLFYSGMAIYENYVQYVNVEVNSENNDVKPNSIRKMVLKILEMTCDQIMKMNCITHDSRDINILIVRFKQIIMKVQTLEQATTCVSMCELFMKIKKKMPYKEWPLLLRRLCKTVTQLHKDDANLNLELQTLYICSLMECEYENDFNTRLLRDQINMFHINNTENGHNKKCLCEIYHNSQHALRPKLPKRRETLLFWFESQQILKHFNTNDNLIGSLFNCIPNNYQLIVLYQNLQTPPKSVQQKVIPIIQTLYESFNSKINRLTRLEHLIYGHLASALMQYRCVINGKTLQIGVSAFLEEKLQYLPTYKEFQNITLKEEFYINKLGTESYMGFKRFFKKIDDEFISSDEALIDWNLILCDLATLAQRFHISGYLDNACQVWLLHYDIAKLIQDNYSALRSFIFLLEYAEYIDQQPSLFSNRTIEEETKSHHDFLIASLKQLTALPSRYQNYVLLYLLQLAYYYIRQCCYCYGQIVLQLVERNHKKLNDRHGKYDIIRITMDIIKIHILWKHYDPYYDYVDGKPSKNTENQKHSTAGRILMKSCLYKRIYSLIDRMNSFTAISSMDYTLYKILLLQLGEMLAECLANRLKNIHIFSFLSAVCKVSLQSRLVLRFIRLMCNWMWLNLQQENVNAARIKLQLIEYFTDMENLKENTIRTLMQNPEIQYTCEALIPSSDYTQIPMVEPCRQVAEKQLFLTIPHELQKNSRSTKIDLKNFFNCSIMNSDNELFSWTWFTIGLLTARLYYLEANYKQLDEFYQQAIQWIDQRQNVFLKNYFQNMQLLSIQHYVNYLRSQGKYENALNCLQNTMKRYFNQTCSSNIDVSYRINLQLQLRTVIKELSDIEANNCAKPTDVHVTGKVLQCNGVDYRSNIGQEERLNYEQKQYLIAQSKQTATESGTEKKTQYTKKQAYNPNTAFIYSSRFNEEEVIDKIEHVVLEDEKTITSHMEMSRATAISQHLKKQNICDALNEAFVIPTVDAPQTLNNDIIGTCSKRINSPTPLDVNIQGDVPINTPRTSRQAGVALQQKKNYRPKI